MFEIVMGLDDFLIQLVKYCNKKKRQGQRGATPKPTCPKCGDILKQNYTREVINGKQQYVASGCICPSSTCDHIIKDLVELEDTEDEN